MDTTRLSTKSQIVLPDGIRVSRAWGPAAEFAVEETGDGIFLRPATRFPDTRLEDVACYLRFRRKPKTDAQMRAFIGREVIRRQGRSRFRPCSSAPGRRRRETGSRARNEGRAGIEPRPTGHAHANQKHG
jgi:bifunctional DNA-binding transcriptional regulator/antitoxin component of YhaV-PrlF toxin-antitoxin module